MRAIECPCGHHLEGADDEELFHLAREHVDRDHPEMQRTDQEIRERVAADAYDAWVTRMGGGTARSSAATRVLDPEGAHLAALLRVADFTGARVLEVGCGDGRLTVGVAEEAASVFAFDPDADAVERAAGALSGKLADRVTYTAASATAVEIPRSAYDIVLFSWSLWWIDPEDVVHVLRRFREALVTDGIVLDLQVIRPHPRVEAQGRVVCEIDGTPLFVGADAARDAVDLLIAEGALEEESVDDHDVLKHYDSGAALVEDFATKERKLPPEAVPILQASVGACVVRERCRLRRLRRINVH